jgi:hypothetical protein
MELPDGPRGRPDSASTISAIYVSEQLVEGQIARQPNFRTLLGRLGESDSETFRTDILFDTLELHVIHCPTARGTTMDI